MGKREEKQRKDLARSSASPGDGEITDCSCGTSEQPGPQLSARKEKAGATFFFSFSFERLLHCRGGGCLGVQRLPNVSVIEPGHGKFSRKEKARDETRDVSSSLETFVLSELLTTAKRTISRNYVHKE